MANNHDPGSARWRFANREAGGSARCARVRDRLVSETVWCRRPFGAGEGIAVWSEVQLSELFDRVGQDLAVYEFFSGAVGRAVGIDLVACGALDSLR